MGPKGYWRSRTRHLPPCPSANGAIKIACVLLWRIVRRICSKQMSPLISPLARVLSERMTQMPEMVVTTATAARSTAARMRLHRERRRAGLRCLTIELRETEIDVLIGKGLLSGEMRNDPRVVCQALYAHLDRTLGSTP